MSDKEMAIKVDGVSKNFLLPHSRPNSVKSAFTGFMRSKKGRDVEVQHALRDVSFEIRKGEFFGIVGRNGSGKSTLLKMLAGIYQPTKGKIETRGRLVPFIELGVGFNPELTGRENVFLNGSLLGFSGAEIEAMYDDIVEFAELEKFMDQKLKNYSSGMQVRLAFSMAVRADADILLIDEVLAVGDADFQRKCFNYFRQLKRAHKTVVFVTHDMDAVREYCDRAMLIEKNQISKIGKTDEVADEYTKLFLDTATKSVESPQEQETDDSSNRWGDQRVVIDSIDVAANQKCVKITEIIEAHEPVEGCVVGIRIRNAAGQHLTGTNTKLERVKIGRLKTGQKMTITWEFVNFLSDGEYFVDSAVQYLDAITVYDWWDDAAAFTVKKMRKIPYATDPGFDVSIADAT